MNHADEPAMPYHVSFRDDHHEFAPGLTVREYFAARAPAEPQAWFVPVMATKAPAVPQWGSIADEKVCEDVRVALDCGTDPVTPEGAAFIEHQNAQYKAADAWEQERRKQRLIQWPWAWADAVIAAGAQP